MKTINIKGAIVSNSEKQIYDWFDMDATSPRDVELGLADANGLDVDVVINSGGGEVYSGSEIFTLLKSYKGTVRVKIVGMAASAASVIAMAGDIVAMSPTAQMMIHNVSTIIQGDYRALEKEAEVLKSHNESIASAYMLKTGKSKEELLNLMDNETYFNAQKALEHGLIDEIMFNEDKKLVASMKSEMLPENVISKIRNFIKNEEDKHAKEKKAVETVIALKKAKLNLLKLMEVEE